MKVSQEQVWTIGDLAAKVGLPTHVLRHWESLGLLAPQRDASGYRRYDRGDLVRVVAIQRNKVAGMSLEQIGALLDGSAAGRHEVLAAHLQAIEDRMQALQRSRAMTEHALACRAHDIAACPRFTALVADLVDGRIAALPRHDSAGRPVDH